MSSFVVCPVYFASVPAQMKALLDRLQPYYFTDLRTRPKRSAVIHVVGAGGDPHGFEPLIGTVRSALSVAGFAVELVLDWVGKIRADGEITADAEEYPLPPVGGFGALGLDFDDDYEVVEVEGVEEIEEVEEEEDNDGTTEAAEHRPKDRAKLSVSQKAPAPKQDAPKSGSRGPRKSSGKGGGPGLREEEHQEEGQRPWRPPIAMPAATGACRRSPRRVPPARCSRPTASAPSIPWAKTSL